MNNKKARKIAKNLKGVYTQAADTLVSMYGNKWATPRKGSFKK